MPTDTQDKAVKTSTGTALLKMGSYSSTTMSVLGQSLHLLSSILTILLTCPNSDTLCYSNEPFITVCTLIGLNKIQIYSEDPSVWDAERENVRSIDAVQFRDWNTHY